jgi:hypothetical protein
MICFVGQESSPRAPVHNAKHHPRKYRHDADILYRFTASIELDQVFAASFLVQDQIVSTGGDPLRENSRSGFLKSCSGIDPAHALELYEKYVKWLQSLIASLSHIEGAP